MRSYSANAKARWKTRTARDLGLHRINGVQRALLNQLWDIQRGLDAEPDPDKRQGWQRAYVNTVKVLRALRHR